MPAKPPAQPDIPLPTAAELDILAVIKTGARRGPAEAVQEDLFKGQNSPS